MVTKVIVFGELKLVKSNPWLSEKPETRSLVESGLVRVKKKFILASPPPWFGDPSKLSPAQIAQVIRFTDAARRHGEQKEPRRTRIERIKAQASGAIEGVPKKPAMVIRRIARIVELAKAYKISVPPTVEALARTPYRGAPPGGAPPTGAPPGGTPPPTYAE